MTSAAPGPTPSSARPPWPHCGRGATAADPVGCLGIHVPGRTACLAHLDETDRAAYLASLEPGADIDHCGTPFTAGLLDQLLDAFRDPATGHPHLGAARFDIATFTGDARFDRTTFTGRAEFLRATFTGDVRFPEAVFTGGVRFLEAAFAGDARFDLATFAGDADFKRAAFAHDALFGGASFAHDARFSRATFTGPARFGSVTFTGRAWFVGATFTGRAGFGGATFAGDAGFLGATFADDAGFVRARFEAASDLGPFTCGGTVDLDGAVFGVPVTVEAAARAVICRRTRWASAATLRLCYAELDLSDAVLEFPLTVTARTTPVFRSDEPTPEIPLSGRDPGVRLTSVGGVDATHLVLHDIDLTTCQFAGAVHLDQLRVDGWCTFATTPAGSWRTLLRSRWWSRRSTLAEEHYWRGWRPRPEGASVLRPMALAALYRQVRKSLEDGKNEPDAADFYYGEMEMRRHDPTRPRAERTLLATYWALSGYGLRATRALVWLLVTMAATLLALTLWGLPAHDPQSTTTGRQVGTGRKITLTTGTPDPAEPTGPLADRMTPQRLEKSLRVVLNSVVFRSSGHELTTAGTYTEMASRLAEPVLLGLAILAVRSRVKR